jgi:redox-sensitive bicupin YhaK (pirin superfamily)
MSMIVKRPARERGHAEHGWLDSWHTFSFADYHDPAHMGFRDLRVINDDRVAPGRGFGAHPHRDMEIVTVPLAGGLAHKDSMGNGSVIRPGDVQRMSAASGIVHSEFNDSPHDPVHFLQIWILPARRGGAPSYEQRHFPEAERRGRLRLVGAHDGREGAVTIHQDVDLYAGLLAAGEKATHRLAPGRHAWVQVARGAVTLNGERLEAGDGAAVTGESALALAGTEDPAEVLLFDLA